MTGYREGITVHLGQSSFSFAVETGVKGREGGRKRGGRDRERGESGEAEREKWRKGGERRGRGEIHPLYLFLIFLHVISISVINTFFRRAG